MSTTTAAPTINVTAEEAETIRMDPYWMAMRVHNNDIEEFDDELELSTGEHIEWLEACQANIERWIRVLRQLESGVLAAEPWLIEEIRKEARRLDDFPEDSAYPAEPARAAEWREIYRLNAARLAALTALADRLEGALVGSEAMTTSEHGWERLREEMGEPNANRLRRAYELVHVPRLPNSAIDGLLEAEINPATTAAMTDGELLRINGVGPVAVSRLRSYQEAAA